MLSMSQFKLGCDYDFLVVLSSRLIFILLPMLSLGLDNSMAEVEDSRID